MIIVNNFKYTYWEWFWGMGANTALVAIVVALLLPGVSHALTNQQEALVGLKGVEVVVGKIRPEAESLGLTEAQIQTDVELRLRKAGVRVLTKKERHSTPGQPDLSVTLTPYIIYTFCVVTVEVQLRELVTLARGLKTGGIIWDVGFVQAVGTQNLSMIRATIGDQVDKFINDYLAANPKK